MSGHPACGYIINVTRASSLRIFFYGVTRVHDPGLLGHPACVLITTSSFFFQLPSPLGDGYENYINSGFSPIISFPLLACHTLMFPQGISLLTFSFNVTRASSLRIFFYGVTRVYDPGGRDIQLADIFISCNASPRSRLVENPPSCRRSAVLLGGLGGSLPHCSSCAFCVSRCSISGLSLS